MTEKLFSGTLNHNQKKKKNHDADHKLFGNNTGNSTDCNVLILGCLSLFLIVEFARTTRA